MIISGAAVTTLFLRARGVLYELWVLSGRPGGGCLPAGVHCVQRAAYQLGLNLVAQLLCGVLPEGVHLLFCWLQRALCEGER